MSNEATRVFDRDVELALGRLNDIKDRVRMGTLDDDETPPCSHAVQYMQCVIAALVGFDTSPEGTRVMGLTCWADSGMDLEFKCGVREATIRADRDGGCVLLFAGSRLVDRHALTSPIDAAEAVLAYLGGATQESSNDSL